ncbi:hypothetical protein TNIN_92321 [Trichonephila inaurata madagascariensis]|uniref:Uncharacterized protein n=1 Tax=Trichonephila inaurata madagascariensis TaxID=2747483 RepID=A0A8X6Y858_9ARAC|nr:hypothetical protein TNIN_92321 [Trichonephila inaurata madagascariensis]
MASMKAGVDQGNICRLPSEKSPSTHPSFPDTVLCCFLNPGWRSHTLRPEMFCQNASNEEKPGACSGMTRQKKKGGQRFAFGIEMQGLNLTKVVVRTYHPIPPLNYSRLLGSLGRRMQFT